MAQAMTFADLNNRHPDSTILVAGTGPSLDKLVDASITGPRIYMNRAAFELPASEGETYWLVQDHAWHTKVKGPWLSHLEAVRSGTAKMLGVFRDPMLAGDGFMLAPRGDNIVHWDERKPDREAALYLTRDQIAQSGHLFQYCGTGATAIHLAWYLGARKVVLAGLDGRDGYAKRLAKFYDSDGRGGFGYQLCRECALKAAKELKLEIEDLSENL